MASFFTKLGSKQKVIALLVIIIWVGLIIVVFILFNGGSKGNDYGDGVDIKNYNSAISDLPQDRRDALNATLFNVIKRNLSGDIPENIDDAVIRDGSVSNDFIQEKNLHYGSFIVDIESIKQSYLLSFEWSDDEENPYFSGYSAVASCLPVDKLLYDDFGCKDPVAREQDPIISFLPYITYYYKVTAGDTNDGIMTLNVTVYIAPSDPDYTDRNGAIERYKSEIMAWIISNGLDAEKYKLEIK